MLPVMLPRLRYNDFDEGRAAADAIMELVQALIDEQVVWVQDLATELNNQETNK